MKHYYILSAALVAVLATACGSEDSGGEPENFFTPKPECEGEPVTALAGKHQMVISALQIGSASDGFDLDGDGEIDNKMSGIGELARVPLEDSFEDMQVVLPLEFFDLDTVQADECVKFAVYAGRYILDRDADGENTVDDNGDCNDFDANVSPKLVEVPGNAIDDDCDGLADELEETTADGVQQTPSDDVEDRDGDGVTIADGDCDDLNALVQGPGYREICGDGYDNNCDGAADWQLEDPLNSKTQVCSPYDEDLEELWLEPFAFTPEGEPVVAFKNGIITDENGTLHLDAGPSKFSVTVPLDGGDSLNLELRISGARMVGDFVMTPAGWGMTNGMLGGVLDANSIDQITGLEVNEIGLDVEDSLLDATYANILGTLIALRRLGGDSEYADCKAPDIDVDQDGIEAFCDTNPTDDVNRVDACIDGDGTVVFDEVDSAGNVISQCTQALDDDGNLRFVDGISITLKLETLPALLPTNIPSL
ncbi:MAG: putative metal-binding motif-containing protein [Deltaproteobacteria bacterium]|nr:putative metal-binding motif-containing protein [Deltaproteobacteria bacterium]